MHTKELPWTELLLWGIVAIAALIVGRLELLGALYQLGIKIGDQVYAPIVHTVEFVDSQVQFIGHLQQIQIEKRQLELRVAELEQELQGHKETTAQNDWLRTQLSLQIPHRQVGTLATVLRYDYTPAPGIVYVSVPETRVSKGDVAVAYRYIVGEVLEVGAGVAKVRLTSASGTSIPVRVGGKVSGVLTGSGGLLIEVREVEAGAGVKVGDAISYLNPGGLDVGNYSLGRVSQINGSAADPSWKLTVELPVDQYALNQMIILPNHE